MTDVWLPFDEKTVPLDELCLFETYINEPTKLEYHAGTFSTNNSKSVIGIVGNHFHFDYTILRYRSIQHLVPKEE